LNSVTNLKKEHEKTLQEFETPEGKNPEIIFLIHPNLLKGDTVASAFFEYYESLVLEFPYHFFNDIAALMQLFFGHHQGRRKSDNVTMSRFSQ
jgi:hypothetical protein